MEEYVKFINALITKVTFNYMTAFIFFLFCSFFLMPDEWILVMDSKTPNIFPSWLSLSILGSISLTFILTAIWIVVCNIASPYIEEYKTSRAENRERNKLLKLLPKLTTIEKEVLFGCIIDTQANHSRDIRYTIAAEKLLALKLIEPSYVSDGYLVNPLILESVISELDKLANSHH
nr:hypothetical protein [uncultured Haemophilus sp.]